VKWRSIKVNVRFSLINSLRYLTFSSVRAVFGRPLPGFRSVADPRSSTNLQTTFTEQSFQLFSGNFGTIVWYLKPSFRNVSIRALSSYGILSITKVIGLTAIMAWNTEKFRAYYNATLHVNIKITMSQTTCCSVTLIIKSTFCSVVKFVLEVCVSINLTHVK